MVARYQSDVASFTTRLSELEQKLSESDREKRKLLSEVKSEKERYESAATGWQADLEALPKLGRDRWPEAVLALVAGVEEAERRDADARVRGWDRDGGLHVGRRGKMDLDLGILDFGELNDFYVLWMWDLDV